MKVVFAGTPAFAQAALVAIDAAGFRIPLVMTQPDRPAGRGLKLRASPVKGFALERHIDVAEPRGLRLDGRYAEDARLLRERLEARAPDAILVAAYGLILPPWLLALPRLGCLNIHASLLPRWRGAAPIQRAIEAGDARTGITLMQMDAGLDTGPVLLREALDIAADETAASLHDRLAPLGARLAVEALELAACGGLVARAQPPQGATYAHKIDKAEARIDWGAPAEVIERRVRAFDPFPGASFQANGASVKLWHATRVDARGAPGEVLSSGGAGPVVACGQGALRLDIAQRAGSTRAPAAQLLAALTPGCRLD